MLKNKKILGLFFTFMSAFAEAPKLESVSAVTSNVSRATLISDMQDESEFLVIPVGCKKKARFKRGFAYGASLLAVNSVFASILSLASGLKVFLTSLLLSPVFIVLGGLFTGFSVWAKHKIYDGVDPEEMQLVIDKKDLVISS